ncbi:MAG: GntR family transcriptional regulator [Acidobacteria bacterium]|nr:GntR family transcriptional regulator [Acidobacteriota bacterium]
MPVMERIAPLETLTDQAHRSIKQYILGGNFSIDERLTESFFADHLGISKSPVREALNALQNEGLLRIEPRKGIYLRRFTAKEISDLYALREALEVYATQIVPITPEFMEALDQSLERTTELLARDNKTAYIEEDIELWLCRCQTYQLTSPDTPAAHHAIARALQVGDREGAATATRDHIRFVRDALLRSQNELDQESRSS